MLYTVIGSLFLIIFGLEIAYNYLWVGPDEGWSETEPLVGHPVRYNISGHIIPVTEMNEYSDDGILPAKHDLDQYEHVILLNSSIRRAVIFMAFINVGKQRQRQLIRQFLTKMNHFSCCDCLGLVDRVAFETDPKGGDKH